MAIESYSFMLSPDQKYNLPDCTSDLMKAQNVDHLCYLYINLKSAQMYLPSPTKLYYGISGLERELMTGNQFELQEVRGVFACKATVS